MAGQMNFTEELKNTIWDSILQEEYLSFWVNTLNLSWKLRDKSLLRQNFIAVFCSTSSLARLTDK